MLEHLDAERQREIRMQVLKMSKLSLEEVFSRSYREENPHAFDEFLKKNYELVFYKDLPVDGGSCGISYQGVGIYYNKKNGDIRMTQGEGCDKYYQRPLEPIELNENYPLNSRWGNLIAEVENKYNELKSIEVIAKPTKLKM